MSKNDSKPKLTDYQTFWKLIVLVVVALFAEGALLVVATSDNAIEWTTTNVHIPHDVSTDSGSVGNVAK